MWFILCNCQSWQVVIINLISGGRCSNCEQRYDRKGQPMGESEEMAMDDFLSQLSDDDAVGFIQSEYCGSFGPKVS